MIFMFFLRYELTGENVSRLILEKCEKLGLDLDKLLG